MSQKINKSYMFVVLFLLASPALSISGILGLGFFPNEKIALILVALSKNAWRYDLKQIRLFGFFCAFILTLLFIFQLLVGSGGLIRASINSIIIVASIPLYFSFLSAHPKYVLRVIFYIGVIQLVISLIQQYFSLTFNYDMAGIYNNYPPQADYIFPIGETGFWYRTSGLFFESSGYGLFQWISIICALKIGIHNRLFGKLILFVMLLEVILNGALTGYLFAFGYFVTNFLVQFRNKKKLLKASLIFPSFLLFIYIIQSSSYYDFSGILTKISAQFAFLYDDLYDYAFYNTSQPSRLSGMFESLNTSLNSEHIMFGSGFSWINPTLDFYSLYIKAYGLTGFMCITLFILFLLRRAPLGYKVAVFFALSVNGHLSTAVNILILSMPLVFFKIDESIKRSLN